MRILIDWGNKDRIEKHFKQLLKKSNLPPDHALKLKKVMERLNRRFDNDDVDIICKEWLHFNAIILGLIVSPPKPENYSRIGGYITMLRHAEPTLRWKDTSGFEIELLPEYASSEISDLFGFLGIELTQFLIDHYKFGIFARCKLDGCKRIIITTNGREYCCDSHKDKFWRKKRKKNKDRDEYQKIRNRLYKQYKTRTYLQKKWSLEEYIRKSWPEDKLHLYDRFARAAK